MDDAVHGPGDAANGTKSPLLREDWDYLRVVALDDFGPDEFALLDAQRPGFYAERQSREVLRMLKA